MVVECNRTVRDMLLEEALPPLKLLDRQLAEPLKRRIGLRHEAGDGHGHLASAPSAYLRIEIDHLLGELFNPDDVLVRLCRQPHHEVELHLLPSVAECRTACREQILLRHALVDDIAQTLCPCLGRKGQPRFPHLLHAGREIN